MEVYYGYITGTYRGCCMSDDRSRAGKKPRQRHRGIRTDDPRDDLYGLWCLCQRHQVRFQADHGHA